MSDSTAPAFGMKPSTTNTTPAMITGTRVRVLPFVGDFEQRHVLRIRGGGETADQRGDRRTGGLSGKTVTHLAVLELRALDLRGRLITPRASMMATR